jgi:exosortase family protein XrtF
MEKEHIQLIARAFGLVLGWVIIYNFVLEPDGRVDDFLTETSTAVGSAVLNVLGYDTSYTATNSGQVLYMGDMRLLGIAHPCNGLILYAIFLGFILIFPSRIKNKLRISLIGLLIIYVLNIGRIVSLSLIYLYIPAFFAVSHHFVFTALLYGVIFLLWMYWINKTLPKYQTA